MPIDIALLAGTVVTGYLMPFVKEGVQEFTKERGKKLGDDAAAHAKDAAPKLLEKVTDLFSGDKEIITLDLFKGDPETFEQPVTKLLEKKLTEDPGAAEELDRIVNVPNAQGQSMGAQILHAVTAGIVDLRGATIGGSGHTFVGVSVGQAKDETGKKE